MPEPDPTKIKSSQYRMIRAIGSKRTTINELSCIWVTVIANTFLCGAFL